MRERLNRYAGEGINPQSQAIGTLGCITRTTAANEMANVSEKIRPPKNLNNVSFCTRDPRMPYKCPLMSRVEYRVARRLGHADAWYGITITLIEQETLLLIMIHKPRLQFCHDITWKHAK